MNNEFPKREHTKVICFFYESETYCVAEYFDGQFHMRRGEAQFAGIVEPDAWVAFPTPMDDGTLEDDKVHQLHYDVDKSIKCINEMN